MARPYLAIIKDAFRATVASRVLYVMIGLIILVLALLAPLHIRETLDWEVSSSRLREVTDELLKELVSKQSNPRYPIVQRIWNHFSEENRTLFTNAIAEAEKNAARETEKDTPVAEQETNRQGSRERRRSSNALANQTADALADELNALMKDRRFYDPELWKSQVLKPEAQALVSEGLDNLTDIRMARLNRLLLNEALKSMPTPNRSSAKMYYAMFHFSAIPAETTRSQIIQPVTSVLRFILDKFVLSLGILIAIIVTANMIPETFEPGSLNLLLSKPIYRAGLLISKFVGGTVFIALCGALLFAGLYLWMGFGLGLWDKATLWSIPLYVVVFAVYFSVSVFVGLLYRSAIVSVVLTGIFWAVCFAIGSTNNFLASRAENDQLVWARPVHNRTFALNKFSELLEWKDQRWQPITMPGETLDDEDRIGLTVMKFSANFPVFPFSEPIVDRTSGRLICLFANPMGLPGIPGGQILISDSNASHFRSFRLQSPLTIAETPNGPLIVFSNGRIKRLKLDKIDVPGEPVPGKTVEPLNDEFMEDVGSSDLIDLRFASRVAYNETRNELAFFSGGVLRILSDNHGKFEVSRKIEVDSGSDRKTLMAHVGFAGNHVLVAFGNARVLVFEAASLKPIGKFQPETRSPPTLVRSNQKNGTFGLLFRNGKLWKWDVQQPDSLQLEKAPSQRDLSGFSFHDGKLTVCHQIDRVSELGTSNRLENTRAGSGDFFTNAYRYALRPLYTLFPKPGEFYRLIDYLSNSRDSRYDPNVDLFEADEHKNPWSPLWSGLAFMAFMLVLSSVYFSRMDC